VCERESESVSVCEEETANGDRMFAGKPQTEREREREREECVRERGDRIFAGKSYHLLLGLQGYLAHKKQHLP